MNYNNDCREEQNKEQKRISKNKEKKNSKKQLSNFLHEENYDTEEFHESFEKFKRK